MENLKLTAVKILLALTVLGLCAVSCEKDDESEPSPSNMIAGKWDVTKLEMTEIGISFNECEIEFIVEDDNSGTFELESGSSSWDGDFEIEKDGNYYNLILEFDDKIKFTFTYNNEDYADLVDEIEFQKVIIEDDNIQLEDGEDNNEIEWEWEMEK